MWKHILTNTITQMNMTFIEHKLVCGYQQWDNPQSNVKLQWSIQSKHTQLALDHVFYLNYRSMHIWPSTRLDNLTWSFTFDSIIRSFWSFWHNYISLWECLLIFLLHGIAFGLFKNHTLYFWSLFLFPSRILVCATGFCSSISLYIWRFTFWELFLAKNKIK